MTDENFTLHELEHLARAWFDCRLDSDEEAALLKALAASRLHSPLLHECRLAMGLETMAARSPRRRTRRARTWLGAAASVALLAALGFAAFHGLRADAGIEVYIDGQRVHDSGRARAIAEAQMQQSRAELEQTLQTIACFRAEAEASEKDIETTIKNLQQ